MNSRLAILGAVIAVSWTAGLEAAQQVTGRVEKVDAAKNELKLSRMDAAGQEEQITLKWKDDLDGAQALESAQAGSQLTVEANDSMGAWEVARVITDSQAGAAPNAAPAAGPTSPGSSSPGASSQY
jgi:hypothetical protein